MLEISELLILGMGYLSLLFGIAYATDQGWIGRRVVRHPLIYVMSLGVFISAWSYYGAMGIAQYYGYDFLPYYFGLSGFFMFGQFMLLPVQRICRNFQLASLADLLTFRFRSQWAGVLVTVFLSLGMLPLLASQIKAVTDSAYIVTRANDAIEQSGSPVFGFAFFFCVVMTLFTILYGAGHVSHRERHNGLVAAIAFETLVKSAALLAIGGAAIFGTFGGVGGLSEWLAEHPGNLALNDLERQGAGRTLLLMSFAAALGMPHMFHMIFSEKPTARALDAATWGMPLLLLVISLPVFPILWGALASQTDLSPEYYTLAIGLALESRLLTAITYIGGLAAASGLIIVSTLALASMCLNHLILPFYQPDIHRDIYDWLIWTRRMLIGAIILGGYLFYRIFANSGNLFDLGVAGFAAMLHFLPGVLALLFVPSVNSQGFIAGLLGGFISWFTALFLPLMTASQPLFLARDQSDWSPAIVLSFTINVILMLAISAMTRSSQEEKSAAALCSMDNPLSGPHRQRLRFSSTTDLERALATTLGDAAARREVGRALQDLNMDSQDARPYAMRRLWERIEINLSGLLGTTVAHDIGARVLPYRTSAGPLVGEDIQLMETRLEDQQANLTGLAAELNSLRRFHRQTLMELPIGACILAQDGEIMLWNSAMSELSGIASSEVVGALIDALPAPWNDVMPQFTANDAKHQHKLQVTINHQPCWLTLHKARPFTKDAGPGDTILLVEDITETQLLEDELIHSERLASVGRLAAGVAHEIGNPVTGIASLAQNLLAEASDPELIELARDIITQTGRINAIVQTLINFSHAGKGHSPRDAVNICECVAEAIKLLVLDKAAKPINYQNQCSSGHRVAGDPQRIIQVFLNLLSNARDACQPHQTVLIESAEDADAVTIKITDPGCGIPAADQERIFEPFFTTKDPGQGTGLGLALVYSIVEDQGGTIHVSSPPPQGLQAGTQIALRLPRYPLEAVEKSVVSG